MKTIQIPINIFSFNELSKEAKELVIIEHYNFLVNVADNEAEALSINREFTIESILINEYYFYSNGKIASTVTYTGKQKKSGNTYYIHDKIEYKI